VVYTTRDMAARAVEVLNNTELPGHTSRKVWGHRGWARGWGCLCGCWWGGGGRWA
jgi:hypothetical protein